MDRTIGECFYQIQNGANIKQGNANGGYPITRIETIANDKFNRDRMGYAGINDILKYESYILEDGDLLMSHINSVQYLGRTVLYEKIEEETIIHGMNLLRLRARSDIINPSYARYCFYGHLFRSQIANITKKSVNQASFAIQDLKQIKIDVPEVGLQKQIVEILNKISWIIEKRKQELDTFDELIRARFVEMFGDLKNTIRLGDCCKVHARIGWQALTRDEHMKTGEYMLVTGTDFIDGKINYNTCVYVTRERYEMDPHIILRENDILITKDGSIGKVAIIHNLSKPATLNSGVFVVRPKDIFNKEYISGVFRGPLFEKFIELSKTGATIKHLNQKHLVEFRIPLPTLEKQEVFARFSNQINKSKFIEKII
jgi:restriction modification system DNA specificity domain protein